MVGPPTARVLATVGLAAAASLVACSGGPAPERAAIPSSIALTPQAVMLSAGAKAVKSATSDGTSVTLDASSPGAADLKPGSIIVIRDVVVLKAADVKRAGGNIVVTATTPRITDLIKNGEITWKPTRVNFRGGTTRAFKTGPRVPGPQAGYQSGGPQIAFARFDRPAFERAIDDGRYTGKIGDYSYDVGFAGADSRIDADGHLTGNINGVNVDIVVKGYLSSFEIGGRLDVQNGTADNLNLLLEKLEGEVELTATATREAGGNHPGQTLLEIPVSYEFPLVIDGIPFVVTLKFALLLNEGLTSVGGSSTITAKLKLNGSQGADWTLPGDPKTEPKPKAEGEMGLNFDLERDVGVGLGPQALLVAMQYPKLGFGLGWGSAHAGPFIDVVTAASITSAGATAIVPCQKGQIIVTGAVGLEAEFLGLWEKSTRVEVYRKSLDRVQPNIKACQ